MSTYYRIEAYDTNTEETKGGIMAPVMAAIALLLGVRPDIPEDKFAKLMAESDNADVKYLLKASNYIMLGMKYPKEYTVDKRNRICLFTEEDYCCKRYIIRALDNRLQRVLPHICLVGFEFELSDKDLLYKDRHQVVITSKTYEDNLPDSMIFFDSEDDGDFKFDEETSDYVDDTIENIVEMERYFDKATELINEDHLSEEKLQELRHLIDILESYYTGSEWRFDLMLDENDQLPKDLKRGVLSEDGLYNLLTEYNERYRKK